MKSVWIAVQKFNAEMDIEFLHISETYGVSPVEAHVIIALLRKDGQRATELARSAGRAATSFTPTLDGLEARGLIARTPDATDRRAICVVLTEEGRKLEGLIAEFEKLNRAWAAKARITFSNFDSVA